MTALSDSRVRPHRVFLSFHQDDRVLAEQVRKVLNREAHAKVFSTDAVRAGEDWGERLRRELKAADVFVLIGTPRAQLSDAVLWELGMAWGAEKPVIVVTDRADREIVLPVDVQALQHVSLDELEREGASRLLARIPQRPR